jgi:hypothetical protein
MSQCTPTPHNKKLQKKQKLCLKYSCSTTALHPKPEIALFTKHFFSQLLVVAVLYIYINYMLYVSNPIVP